MATKDSLQARRKPPLNKGVGGEQAYIEKHRPNHHSVCHEVWGHCLPQLWLIVALTLCKFATQMLSMKQVKGATWKLKTHWKEVSRQ